MADESLSRRIASAVLSALKSGGHILIARGGIEAVVRELDLILAPALPRIVARAARGFVSGEVTSTFGDEATDEAVEEMVSEIREAVVESEHVEDVFAEDRELERFIFRVLREELLEAWRTEDDETEERVPISVRLDTLGYVAATAARQADEATVRAALERAARQADGELEKFEPLSRTALFAMPSEDPEHRIEVEEAVAEELTGLVTGGLVVLPTVERRVALGRELAADAWRALRPRVDMVAKRLLVATGVPLSWRPEGAGIIRLSFTPLSEKDSELIDEIAAAFHKDVRGLLSREVPPRDVLPPSDPPEEAPPTSARGGPPTRRSPGAASVRALSRAALDDAPRSSRNPTSSSAPRSDDAPVRVGPKSKRASDAPESKRASDVPVSKRPSTKPKSESAPPKSESVKKSDAPRPKVTKDASTRPGKTTAVSAKADKADKPPTSKRR